jgi:hypothetical protein
MVIRELPGSTLRYVRDIRTVELLNVNVVPRLRPRTQRDDIITWMDR